MMTTISGVYYSRFKDMAPHDTDMGYTIASIEANADAVISMEQGTHGLGNI